MWDRILDRIKKISSLCFMLTFQTGSYSAFSAIQRKTSSISSISVFFFPLFACLFKFLPITLWFKLSHVRMGAQALGEHWLGDCTHHSDEEYKWYPSFRQWRDVTQEDKWARVQMLRQEQGSLEVEMLWKFRKDTSTAGSRTLTWGWNPVLMWKRSKGKERSV